VAHARREQLGDRDRRRRPKGRAPVDLRLLATAVAASLLGFVTAATVFVTLRPNTEALLVFDEPMSTARPSPDGRVDIAGGTRDRGAENTPFDFGATAKVIAEQRRANCPNHARNPERLFREASFTPYYEDGKVLGVLAARVEGDSFWSQIGLRRGDLVIRLGDLPLRRLGARLHMIKYASTSTDVRLRIVRETGLEQDLVWIEEGHAEGDCSRS